VTSGGSGDVDLYVKFGSAPTQTSYDCRPYQNGNNETCTISNIQAGKYHVMLYGYSAFSGVSLTGTYATGGGGNSGSSTNLSASTNNWYRETINVPAGMTQLKVDISGGSGDADLYLNFGSQPTSTTYSCRPYKNGNVESCTISNPQAGTWYVGLKAYRTFNGVTMNWLYQ
jgi:serine protease